jgi:hypothetical protein
MMAPLRGAGDAKKRVQAIKNHTSTLQKTLKSGKTQNLTTSEKQTAFKKFCTTTSCKLVIFALKHD